jgi:hypothetical protein
MENDIILTYRGKSATKEDIAFINDLMAKHPDASRNALSKQLCQAWNWVQANGSLRDMVARGFIECNHDNPWIFFQDNSRSLFSLKLS